MGQGAGGKGDKLECACTQVSKLDLKSTILMPKLLPCLCCRTAGRLYGKNNICSSFLTPLMPTLLLCLYCPSALL